MHIEYTSVDETKISFQVFENSNLGVTIGFAEGYLGVRNDLISVIKVSADYQKKGYGLMLFQMVFEYFSSRVEIGSIVGAWYKDEEFSYVEGGQSTNLSIFQNLISEGCSEMQAALGTPTGKWATQLGYNEVIIENISDTAVNVRFEKAY